MEKQIEHCKWLSSLAVFGQLYDNKKDIYEIISQLLSDLIISTSMFRFNLTEITHLLNTSYEYEIPEAVVGTALRRLKHIQKEGPFFVVDMSVQVENFAPLADLKSNMKADSESLISELLSFVRDRIDAVNDHTSESIVRSFCSFLLDERVDDQYTALISVFILNNQNDTNFTRKINQIREGVILYSGLKYDNNLNEIGTWNNQLTIFLDMEILFHIAGFNGNLYEQLFNEFYEQITYVNNKAKKKLIDLKYFSHTRDDVFDFFRAAEHILEGKGRLNPANSAMTSILNGCSKISEIQSKQSDFFTKLRNKGILEDDYNEYLSENNYRHNIAGEKEIIQVQKELGIDISDYLRPLTFISIRRGESNGNNFANIRYILMTGKTSTINIAWHSAIKGDGNVPLASTLYWLTNKFWFKLNRSFGKTTFPKSMDAIIKARIALSGILNDSIGIKYEELQLKYQKGDITEEMAKARLVHLRTQVRKPEEICQDDITSLLDTISEESLEEFIKEQEVFKIQSKKHEDENKQLKNIINQTKKEQEEKLREQEDTANKNALSLKVKLLDEKVKQEQLILNQKGPLDKIIDDKYFQIKVIIFFFFAAYYISFCLLIVKFGWDLMEQLTYITGLVPLVFAFFYLLFFEKSLSPVSFFNKLRAKSEKNIYARFNFNESNLRELQSEIVELQSEINMQDNTENSKQK